MDLDDRPMDIEYTVDKVGNITVRENDSTVAFDGSVNVTFWVHTDADVLEKALDLTIY